MHVIDWTIVAVLFAGLWLIALHTRRASNSVADFLAANRCGRRYLLTMADGMASLGAISIVAYFERSYQAGFCAEWWGQMLIPVGLIISMSGWVVYRYRETRALTLAQFFEIRYSKRFRIFSGILAWIAGIINYGVFPSVGARLIISLANIPPYTYQLGPLELNLTLGVVMFILLTVSVYLTFAGGQITIMVTDFFQAQLTNIIFLAIMAYVFLKFGWTDILEGLSYASEGKSMINPFKQGDIPEFNYMFFVILAFGAFYGHLAWQGNQGYNCSAISPHEAKMGKVLGIFRSGVVGLMMMLLPILVFAVMHSPKYSILAGEITEKIAQIPDTQTQIQQTTPLAVSFILPTGLIGLFVAVCIAAAVSTNDTYLHSWGSVFIQDVVLPFRKKRIDAKTHMKFLRYSIFGVATFSWFFSMLFPLREYIFMFFQITGAIFTGGAGAAIIGGLYWKRGTTAGAWAGLITGSVLAFSSILISNIFWPYILPALQSTYPDWQYLQGLNPEKFPIHGAWLGFYSSIVATATYVVVSLLSGGHLFNLDKMLYRGKYDLNGEHTKTAVKVPFWYKIMGMGKEFTGGDRVIYILGISWLLFHFLTFLIGTIYHLTIKPFSDEVWGKWWLFITVASGIVGSAATGWFLWGGFKDLKHLFRDLKTAAQNDRDDGTVDNQNDPVK